MCSNPNFRHPYENEEHIVKEEAQKRMKREKRPWYLQSLSMAETIAREVASSSTNSIWISTNNFLSILQTSNSSTLILNLKILYYDHSHRPNIHHILQITCSQSLHLMQLTKHIIPPTWTSISTRFPLSFHLFLPPSIPPSFPLFLFHIIYITQYSFHKFNICSKTS